MVPCEIRFILEHIRIAVPGSLRDTTTTDGGSADIAGANICQSIHGHIRTAFLALCVIQSIHGHKKSAKNAAESRIISYF
jgi:hypothetical protein